MCANYWKNINWISPFSLLELCLHRKLCGKKEVLLELRGLGLKNKQTTKTIANYGLEYWVTKYGMSWIFHIILIILAYKYDKFFFLENI